MKPLRAAAVLALSLQAASPALVLPAPLDGQADPRQDYLRAARFLPWKLRGKVLNKSVVPQWVDGDRFWYRRELPGGQGETVLVDPGKRRSRAVPCSAEPRVCAPTSFITASQPGLLSPDGRTVALVKDYNIWLHDLATGQDRQLTFDGAPHYGYGAVPEMAINQLAMRRSGAKPPPYSAVWSPDSRVLVVPRLDERLVKEKYLLESAPAHLAARAVLHVKRSAEAGEVQPAGDYSAIDIGSGRATPLGFGPVEREDVFLSEHTVAWSPDSRQFYTITRSRWGQSGAVLAVDVENGVVRRVLEEQSTTNFVFNSTIDGGGPNVRILPASNEVIWFSERDGWGHLYLYDLATGQLKNRITEGPWLVRDIVEVDGPSRMIYFTAGGRESGRNPYFRHFYRVSFDGSHLTLLTPENADHDFAVRSLARFGMYPGAAPPAPRYLSPSGRYVVDTYSTPRDPPVSVLRRTSDGAVVLVLERADARALLALDWQPPEPFRVTAADGVTDLYGLLYRPTNFDSTRRYPVLDHIYQGPNLAAVPWNYTGFEDFFNSEMQARADLGFIIVQLDGRGTANRSKAFRDAMYGKLAEFRIDDHVAAVKELAQRIPQIDLSRVGMYGHSFGGYATVRAMLLYPDFYKVGISSGGIHSYDTGIGNWGTQFLGPLEGLTDSTGKVAFPAHYLAADNRRMAGRLQGKLMLAYADLDENTGPATVVQLVSALTDADKTFELVLMPGRTHYFSEDPYFIRRSWDFLLQHLKGETPPTDFLLVPTKPPT